MPSASKMRSEPEAWSARVITARPPAAFHGRGDRRVESVATTTGPTPAASARRITCTIIGTPAMSASGLPGSRVEAMRAGIRIRTSEVMDNAGRAGLLDARKPVAAPLIRVASAAANRLSVRRRGAVPRRFQPDLPPSQEPIRDGLLRTQQDPGRRCWSPACACCRSTSPPARSSRRTSRKSPATRSRSQEAGRRRKPAKPPRPDEPIDDAARQRRRRARARMPPRNAGLPHLRQGRAEPRRPEPLGRGRPPEGARRPASTIRPP